MFQSPLHRGLGSDFLKGAAASSTSIVSIPSSSGPGFGRCGKRSTDCACMVSIPSSSGPGFGLPGCMCPCEQHEMFQSPLHRGLGSDVAVSAVFAVIAVFQSPLHRGLGSDVEDNSGNTIIPPFQSPLHRGLGSDDLNWGGGTRSTYRFNPLFIGAWVRTCSM